MQLCHLLPIAMNNVSTTWSSSGIAWNGADAMTVNRGLNYARRAENRRNLGGAIPWTHLFFQKSGLVGL